MKKVTILGSTGSIGVNTLKVCSTLGFRVVALATHRNIELLKQQIVQFAPMIVAVYDRQQAKELRKSVSCLVLEGPEGVNAVASYNEADIVMAAISGTKGIAPVASAIETGLDVALANKESLVSAGELLIPLAQKTGSRILPVDSEHNAIFQCLQGGERPDTITLTASGGPFRNHTKEELRSVTIADALKHPTWVMGAKNTIDSSTLMNKGLEVIEAHHLFQMPFDKIKVVIHPQSLIHGMVSFRDGSTLMHIAENDMKVPIQHALTHPTRYPGPALDFATLGPLTFGEPDLDRFPALRLAYEAGKTGGTLPAVMNAVNEMCVQEFLAGRMPWHTIAEVVSETMATHTPLRLESIDHVIAIDEEIRALAPT